MIQTVQMGRSGIKAVMPCAVRAAMHQALQCQEKEYSSIEREAKDLAKRKGYQLKDVPSLITGMSAMSARGRLMWGDRDSKIAGMMIQGNTRGMIQSLKNMRRCGKPDPTVAELAQKLLDTEIANIRQMEGFL